MCSNYCGAACDAQICQRAVLEGFPAYKKTSASTAITCAWHTIAVSLASKAGVRSALLCESALVLARNDDLFLDMCTGQLRGLVRQLSIDQFENEGRRVSMGTDSVGKPQRTPLFDRHTSDPGVHKVT